MTHLSSLFSGLASGVRRLASSSGCRPVSSSRSGIALVMVLGILSVMVIMAVAFAISMRTERVAAGNYADSVRTRQLVQVGIARALNQLVDTNGSIFLGTNGLSSSSISISNSGSKVYADWPTPVVVSHYDLNVPYTNTSANVYLLYATDGSTRANEATNFVPRAL